MDEELADMPVNELLQEGMEPSSLPVVDSGASGSNIIDATQNAIIGTAENVTQVFDATETINTTSIPHEPIYMEIEFWVGAAFVLTVLVLLKPALKFIIHALRGRIQKVLTDIDEASKLRDDAQVLLADYERRFANASTQIAELTDVTQKNLRNLKKYETSKMKEAFEIREKELRRNLQTEIENIRGKFNQEISQRAVELAQNSIEAYLQDTDESKLIDDALDELDKLAD